MRVVTVLPITAQDTIVTDWSGAIASAAMQTALERCGCQCRRLRENQLQVSWEAALSGPTPTPVGEQLLAYLPTPAAPVEEPT